MAFCPCLQTGTLEPLAGLSSLQSLTFAGGITARLKLTGTLEPLARLSSLQSLKIDECHELTGTLEPLAGLSSLQSLNIVFCYELTGTLEPLAGLSSLQSLCIARCEKLTGTLEPVVGLSSLQSLMISCVPRLTGTLEPLAGLSSLQSLYLYGADPDDPDVLDDVNLPADWIDTQFPLILTGTLELLAGLSSLQSLKIDECHELTGTLKPLAGLSSLQSLEINCCEKLTVNDDGLQALANGNLKRLSRLIIPWNNTTCPEATQQKGAQAILRYYSLLSIKSTICTRVKLVVLGPGCAGKSSLISALRYLDSGLREACSVEVKKRGSDTWRRGKIFRECPNGGLDIHYDDGEREDSVPVDLVRRVDSGRSGPSYPVDGAALRPPDDRTIALDLGDLWDTFTVYDFAGQPEYYAFQKLFLTAGALFLVVVDLHTEPRHQKESLEEQLNVLACSVPDAAVVVVGTKADLVSAHRQVQARLEELDKHLKGWQARWKRSAATFLSVSAAEGADATQSSSKQELPEPVIYGSVMAVSSQDLRGCRDLREAMFGMLIRKTPRPLFPRFRQKIPQAFEHVRSLVVSIKAGMSRGEEQIRFVEEMGHRAEDGDKNCKVHYVQFKDLDDRWESLTQSSDVIAKSLASGDAPTQVLQDAVGLLEAEGLVITSQRIDVVHVNPAWLVDVVKVMADHTLRQRVDDEARRWCEVLEQEGAVDAGAVEDMLEDFVKCGVASRSLLDFLLRDAALKSGGLDVDSLIDMLVDKRLLFPAQTQGGDGSSCFVAPVQLMSANPRAARCYLFACPSESSMDDKLELENAEPLESWAGDKEVHTCELWGKLLCGFLPPGFVQMVQADLFKPDAFDSKSFRFMCMLQPTRENRLLVIFDATRARVVLRSMRFVGTGQEPSAVAKLLQDDVLGLASLVERIASEFRGVHCSFKKKSKDILIFPTPASSNSARDELLWNMLQKSSFDSAQVEDRHYHQAIKTGAPGVAPSSTGFRRQLFAATRFASSGSGPDSQGWFEEANALAKSLELEAVKLHVLEDPISDTARSVMTMCDAIVVFIGDQISGDTPSSSLTVDELTLWRRHVGRRVITVTVCTEDARALSPRLDPRRKHAPTQMFWRQGDPVPKSLVQFIASELGVHTRALPSYDVFISHCPRDSKDWSVSWYEHLTHELGYKVFVDRRLAQDEHEVSGVVCKSKSFLFVLSENTLQDDRCLFELHFAVKGGIPIVPIRLENTMWEGAELPSAHASYVPDKVTLAGITIDPREDLAEALKAKTIQFTRLHTEPFYADLRRLLPEPSGLPASGSVPEVSVEFCDKRDHLRGETIAHASNEIADQAINWKPPKFPQAVRDFKAFGEDPMLADLKLALERWMAAVVVIREDPTHGRFEYDSKWSQEEDSAFDRLTDATRFCLEEIIFKAADDQRHQNLLLEVVKEKQQESVELYQETAALLRLERNFDSLTSCIGSIRKRLDEVTSRGVFDGSLASDSHPLQLYRSILGVYRGACETKIVFDSFLRDLSTCGIGIKPLYSGIKKPYRIVEKLALNESAEERTRAEVICDVVRGSVTCCDFVQMIEVVKCIRNTDTNLRNGKFSKVATALSKWVGKVHILRIKDRFKNPTSAGWSDLMINLLFVEDSRKHVCELQIHHIHLLTKRTTFEGHKDYGLYRCAFELLEALGKQRELDQMQRDLRSNTGDQGPPGARTSSPTHGLTMPGRPGGAAEVSELEGWLENVAHGFSQKYLAAFAAFGLDQLDMLRDLEEQDIADFFEDKKVLGTVQDGEFPRMHRRRLERAMKAVAASGSS